MSSGYPGHSGGAGQSSGQGHQPNPPYTSMSSRGTIPGGTHPPPSQLLPPSPAPSPQPHSPQVSSQKSVGSTGSPKAKWYFSPDRLSNTPSVEAGIPIEKELSYRQQAANFIQDMGQRLKVTQLCINTAIVYMQRFYMFHSFTKFHRNTIAAASLFLAAKVEEQPRKLEHVIKVAHICLHRDQPQLDSRSDAYIEQAQELVINENILLQTLGFDVAIDHPHTHVVHCCQLVKASKELAQTSYFMATNSLHLTTMCLRHPPKIVACVCIHLACKWSNYKIPLSKLKKEWFMHVLEPNWNMDSATTLNLLEELTNEFLTIFEQCPSRLKKKIMASTQATKQEEERQKNSNDQPGNYQPDLSLHNESANAGTNSSIMLGQQHKSKHASSNPNKQPGHHVQRHSSNQSGIPHGASNPNPHGVHPSASVPGSHLSSAHSQGNIPSSSNAKHGSHLNSSHPSRSHGHPSAAVDKSIRSGSSHRQGDKHATGKLNIPGSSNASSGGRHPLHSQHPQQPSDPNRHPMSMAPYKDRQVQPPSGTSHLNQNVGMQNSQSRTASASMGDPMQQARDNRKRIDQTHHHSNAKKAQLSNVQNPMLIPSHSVSSNRSLAEMTSHQSSGENKDRDRQQSMPGIDTSFNSPQNKYSGSRNSANSAQLPSSRSWQQPHNPNRTSSGLDTARSQQPAQVKKSIFDIDSPPPISNQSKPFDKMSLDRTESLEPGEIIDEDSQETSKGQLSGPIGTAPSTTVTPLQQRLFGSSGQTKSSGQSSIKSTSSSKEPKDAAQKSERKYMNPMFPGASTSMKTQSPVKQSKLNVINASNSLDSTKPEMSAANRRSLFSPPSDTEGQAGGQQTSPFKVIKSPANNNRQSSSGRDGRRAVNNSATSESRSPRIKQETLKPENFDGYATERDNNLLQIPKQENTNMSMEYSDLLGSNRNSNITKNLTKTENEDKAISLSLPTAKVPEHTESQSYDSPSERHRKHKKEKKEHKRHKKEKKKDHDRDKDRDDRKEKDRSSSKHHSHSKHSSDYHGSEHHSQHKISSNSHHHKHHRSHTQDQNALSNSTNNTNQFSMSSMTPTGPMAYDATTPHIDTPTSTTSTTSSGLKLKIKLPPPPGGTPVSSQGNNSKAPSIAPLRISLGGSGDQNRKRSHKGDGHGGPASKMSRVLGTPLESEHKFLASKGLSHSSKSHKKVK